jgi:hypothetical protein
LSSTSSGVTMSTRSPLQKNGANLPGTGWSPDRTIVEADLGKYVDKSLERKKEIALNGYIVTQVRM